MGHPWVYAQAIARIDGAPEAGDEVEVRDPRGNCLGRGYYSPSSAIAVRLVTRDPSQRLDGEFLSRRIAQAAAWRRTVLGLPSEGTTAWRAVNAEGDGLAGLIVDRYGDAACVQCLTVGIKRREELVFTALREHLGVRRIYEVASAKHQRLEGIDARDGLRWSADDLHGPLRFRENELDIEVPPPGDDGGGQKTGYYLDQRDNRAMIAGLSAGARVLDLYTHAGGFALAALKSGAREVVGIDSSAPAIERARAIAARNGLASARFIKGDVRKVLGDRDELPGNFDVVVCDPPRLASHGREVRDALQHYRRTNALAMARVEPGGLILTCSCSGSVSLDDFLRAAAAGARDAGRELAVLRTTGPGADHPYPAAFDEGRYLKCVLARVT